MQFQFVDEFSKIEYQEVIQTTTDQYGMVNLVIGTGTPNGGYAASFDNIAWVAAQKKLVVSINISGDCSSFTEISNQPFTTVPFAYAAINSTNVTGVVAVENGGTNATTVIGAKTTLGLDQVDNAITISFFSLLLLLYLFLINTHRYTERNTDTDTSRQIKYARTYGPYLQYAQKVWDALLQLQGNRNIDVVRVYRVSRKEK